MTSVLETARLLLRDERLEDVDAFLAYRCKETYWRHIPIEPPTPESIAKRTARLLPTQTQAPRTFYMLAAVEKDSGEVIGEATVNALTNHSAEIGFSFHTRAGGAGLEQKSRPVFSGLGSATCVCTACLPGSTRRTRLQSEF